MEDQSKSLAMQYDIFVNNTLKLLDTTVERDYIQKLRLIDELTYKINESEDDKETIKKTLEAVQDECSKLTYKLKTSARLLDEANLAKEKIEIEKESMKTQLEQLYSVFKKPDTSETIQTGVSHFNRSGSVQTNEKRLNNTEALLSDISYSNSEDSSYENVIKSSKPNPPTLMKKRSASNILNGVNTKTFEIKNMNVNGRQIIATTTVTMDLGHLNAKSVIKTQQTPTTSKSPIKSSSSSASVESLSSNESENDLKPSNILNTNIEKKHNFIEKFVVIPEICGQCQKKIKFNDIIVKCMDCKTSAHLECKHLIPDICTLSQYQINALNCGIPPLIVHCIGEIERRGLNTIGLYRISGSDKEVKILREKFHKSVPNLHEVDIHVLCCCLKDFIRKQENKLISQSNLSKLNTALKKNDADSKSLRKVVCELPSNNLLILAFLILHLQKVASSPKCNMDNNCLAIVFGPTIVGISSTSLSDLHNKSEVIIKVVTELLMLPKIFWLNLIKADSISSSDELLHSTPAHTPGSSGTSNRFFSSSGLKRRILSSPKKHKLPKRVDFEDKIESSE